jgi:hypothetical protein
LIPAGISSAGFLHPKHITNRVEVGVAGVSDYNTLWRSTAGLTSADVCRRWVENCGWIVWAGWIAHAAFISLTRKVIKKNVLA